MDKEEFRVKLDQINHLVEKRDYKGAMEVVDSIDWRRVKNVRTLCVVGEIYAANKRYEDSKEIFLLAYHRAPIGKNILYRLIEVSLKSGNIEEAMEYYEEFLQVAPNDSIRYVLKYKIYKENHTDLNDLIQMLEEYKEKEFTEKWSYELAKLYHEAGQDQKCIALCDELELWFSDGKYVAKALELKTKITGVATAPKAQTEQSGEKEQDQAEDAREIEEENAEAAEPKEELLEEGNSRIESISTREQDVLYSTSIQEKITKGIRDIFNTKKNDAEEEIGEDVQEEMLKDAFSEEGEEEAPALEEEDGSVKTEKKESHSLRMPEFKIPKGMKNTELAGMLKVPQMPKISKVDLVSPKEKEEEDEFNLEDTILAAASAQGIEIPEEKTAEEIEEVVEEEFFEEADDEVEEEESEFSEDELEGEFEDESEEELEEYEEEEEFSEDESDEELEEYEEEEEFSEEESDEELEEYEEEEEFAEEESDEELEEYEEEEEFAEDESDEELEEYEEEEEFSEDESDEELEEYEEEEEFAEDESDEELEEYEEEEFSEDESEEDSEETTEDDLDFAKWEKALEQVEETEEYEEESDDFFEQPIEAGPLDIVPRRRELTDEEVQLFSYFVEVPGMKEQIINTLIDAQDAASDKTSRTGNIVVMGGRETGKTKLISALIPSICKELNLEASKVAYIFAEQIEGKNIAEIVSKLAGGFLVIAEANGLTNKTVEQLNKAMEFRTDGLTVILEDTKAEMRKLLSRFPKFAEKFTSTINIPVFTNDELVGFAEVYTRENGFCMDSEGMTALYNLISSKQDASEPMSIGSVREILNAAIKKSQSGILKLKRKRTDEAGYQILTDKDFN